MKMVAKKLREDGEIGWWEVCEVLWRKFELDNKGLPVSKLMKKI